jgi:ferric-chelate reductase
VFLIIPSVSGLPFEAHPFTIASIESPDSHGGVEKIHSTERYGSTQTSLVPSDSLDGRASSNELVFLINVRKGFTKLLANTAAKKGLLKVFVDGPYGPSADLHFFDTSVLIAGAW